MASPFPGMDPYLESSELWSEVHSRLIVAIADTLAPSLHPKYYAAIDKRTYLDTPEDEEVTERYIEIRETETANVIVAIEILSPKNKQKEEGRTAYLTKRQRVLATQTHLVEIDLLRGRSPMPTNTKSQTD